MQASLALNGAYALFLDDLLKGATTYSARYQKSEAFSLSQRLFHHWRESSMKLEPGDEYKLVDDFADMTGLRGWYEWQPDPGDHKITEDAPKEGTTNPELLKQK